MFGNLICQTNNGGEETYLEYDPRGRLTKKSYSNAAPMADVEYEYGIGGFAKDRLIQTDDESGSRVLVYNSEGAVVAKTNMVGGFTFVTEMEHDALGRVRAVNYPHAPGSIPFSVTYEYQEYSGLLNKIKSGETTYLAGISYDQLGRRVDMTYGNHVMTTYAYDPQNYRLSSQKVKQENGATLANTEYAFDGGGNVTGKVETVENHHFDYEYDSQDRLVRSRFTTPNQPDNTAGYDEYFGYDPAGNILYKDVNLSTGANRGNRNYAYAPGTHRVASYTSEWGTDFNAQTAFEYDSKGNRTKKLVHGSDGTLKDDWQYEFDGENRLKRVRHRGKVSGSYVYDDSGERTVKVTETLTTYYLDGLTQKAMGGGVKHFIFDGVNRIAIVQSTDGAAAKTFFLHTDHIGSTSLVTSMNGNELGEVREKLEYKAFGSMFMNWSQGEGWTLCPSDLLDLGGIGFTGQEQDSESELMYYGARFYDPQSGRFVSADTVIDGVGLPEGYNRYALTHNNPIRYNDPTGHRTDNDGNEVPDETTPPDDDPPPSVGSSPAGKDDKGEEGDTDITYDASGNIHYRHFENGRWREGYTYNSDGEVVGMPEVPLQEKLAWQLVRQAEEGARANGVPFNFNVARLTAGFASGADFALRDGEARLMLVAGFGEKIAIQIFASIEVAEKGGFGGLGVNYTGNGVFSVVDHQGNEAAGVRQNLFGDISLFDNTSGLASTSGAVDPLAKLRASIADWKVRLEWGLVNFVRLSAGYNYVKATREGLVGATTADGTIIRSDSMFAALPSRSALGKNVEIIFNTTSVTVTVRDVGPWNISDEYWKPGLGIPASEFGRAYSQGVHPNGAGIDLSDGVFKKLGLKDNDYVYWRFVH